MGMHRSIWLRGLIAPPLLGVHEIMVNVLKQGASMQLPRELFPPMSSVIVHVLC